MSGWVLTEGIFYRRRAAKLRFRHRAFSFQEAIESKNGQEAFREATVAQRFSEYRNGSETFSERLRKAKMRPGGKNVASKELRKENKQFQAAHCFSSF